MVDAGNLDAVLKVSAIPLNRKTSRGGMADQFNDHLLGMHPLKMAPGRVI